MRSGVSLYVNIYCELSSLGEWVRWSARVRVMGETERREAMSRITSEHMTDAPI